MRQTHTQQDNEDGGDGDSDNAGKMGGVEIMNVQS